MRKLGVLWRDEYILYRMIIIVIGSLLQVLLFELILNLNLRGSL